MWWWRWYYLKKIICQPALYFLSEFYLCVLLWLNFFWIAGIGKWTITGISLKYHWRTNCIRARLYRPHLIISRYPVCLWLSLMSTNGVRHYASDGMMMKGCWWLDITRLKDSWQWFPYMALNYKQFHSYAWCGVCKTSKYVRQLHFWQAWIMQPVHNSIGRYDFTLADMTCETTKSIYNSEIGQMRIEACLNIHMAGIQGPPKQSNRICNCKRQCYRPCLLGYN